MTEEEYEKAELVIDFESDDELFGFKDLVQFKGEQEARRFVERKVNADIDSFERFFISLGNEGLALPERASIKTYLAWKLGLASNGKK